MTGSMDGDSEDRLYKRVGLGKGTDSTRERLLV